MTLVTRSAIRLSRRGGQQLKNARANAALFNTAANQAKNIVPKLAASSSRVTLPAKAGEYFATLFFSRLEVVCTLDEVDVAWGYEFGFSRPARRVLLVRDCLTDYSTLFFQPTLPAPTPLPLASRLVLSRPSLVPSLTSTSTLTTSPLSLTPSKFSLVRVRLPPKVADSFLRSLSTWVRTLSDALPWTVPTVLSEARRLSTLVLPSRSPSVLLPSGK